MKTVYIGGNKWSVTHKAGLKLGSKYVWGWTDSRKKEIRVRSGLGQDSDQTLFHELVHAACREYASAGSETSILLAKLSDDDLAVDIIAKEMSGALRQLGMVK